MIPDGVGGGILPEDKKRNILHNDKKSKFTSVNENHHNYTVTDLSHYDEILKKILELDPRSFAYDTSRVDQYIIENLDDPEWISFFKGSKTWRKHRRAILVSDFKSKQNGCKPTYVDIEKHLKSNPINLEEDLKFLFRYKAVDPVVVKKIKKLFPNM